MSSTSSSISARSMSINMPSKLSRIDYQDVFEVNVLKTDLTLYQALDNMFINAPRWIVILLEMRNQATKIFGLKGSEGATEFSAKKLIVGERWGFVDILEISDTSACFRGDDAHLNFVVYFQLQGSVLSCLTQVQFNNIWGRLYFTAVEPFHKLIVPALLKGAIQGEAK